MSSNDDDSPDGPAYTVASTNDDDFPDGPAWPWNTEMLLEILAAGDRVYMTKFFREFQRCANSDEGAPLHWQRFVGKILVNAAENHGDEAVELGLSEKTETKHRDRTIFCYIHALRLIEEKRRGEEDLTGSLNVALKEAAEALDMKKGTLSRIYAQQDDSIVRTMVQEGFSFRITPPRYLEMIARLRKK